MDIQKKLFRAAWRPIGVTLDALFDLRYGVNTWGYIPLDRLGFTAAQTREMVWYQPTPFCVVERALKWVQSDFLESGNPGIEEFAFCDIGCGKGRVLLAASKFPFSEVVGIDISQTLCEIARKNIEVFKRKSKVIAPVQVLCTDARHFVFPNQNVMIWLFTPFKGAIMEAVLKKVAIHADRFRVLIIYAGANRSVLELLRNLHWQERFVFSWRSIIDLQKYSVIIFDSRSAS